MTFKYIQSYKTIITILIVLFVILKSNIVLSNELENSTDKKIKPFILAKNYDSIDMIAIENHVKKRLKKARFEIIGQYSPYKNAKIIVISNPQLRYTASLSENGIYAAIQRVTITVFKDTTQVAFTNPTYMAHAYRLKSDLSAITKQLKTALGFIKEYGAQTGFTKSKLRQYQYKWMMMPNFTDRLELAEYPNQKVAIKNVLLALKKNDAGVKKVYQVNLKGKSETIIGVQMEGNSDNSCSSDSYIMNQIDSKNLKSTGHLPYEIIIKNGVVNALFAEFRIAMNFPDLSMMGKNSFGSIMCAPNSILEALTIAAGGDPEESW